MVDQYGQHSKGAERVNLAQSNYSSGAGQAGVYGLNVCPLMQAFLASQAGLAAQTFSTTYKTLCIVMPARVNEPSPKKSLPYC